MNLADAGFRYRSKQIVCGKAFFLLFLAAAMVLSISGWGLAEEL